MDSERMQSGLLNFREDCEYLFALISHNLLFIIYSTVHTNFKSFYTTSPSHHGVFHDFQSKAFLAKLMPFFLATAFAFFLRCFLIAGESVEECRIADLNLILAAGTTNGFTFQMINSLMESWGVHLT